MAMPAIAPEDNEVVNNALLPSGVVSFPVGRLDSVVEGGRTDGNKVNEEVLDVGALDVEERDTICEELVSTRVEVAIEVATASELEELVGVADVADAPSVVRMVIVRGPVSVKPPPSTVPPPSGLFTLIITLRFACWMYRWYFACMFRGN